MQIRARLTAALAAALTVSALVAAPALAATPTAPKVSVQTAAWTSDPLTYTYAGDSITNPGNSWSYTRFLQDGSISTPGGVGISGATSAEVLAAAGPQPADVLVVMVGTNDIRFGTNPKTVRDNVKAIISKVGAEHVVIAAVAPSNLTDYGSDHINRAVDNVVLNRTLSASASNNGWLFVDPWDNVRKMDGTWAAGRSQSDGVHPAVSTMSADGDAVGHRFDTYIRQAVQGSQP